MSNTSTRVYYNEGIRSKNKFVFEVYQEEDGSYRAVVSRWNLNANRMAEQTSFFSATKEGLREQAYPRVRQVSIFLDSDFWSEGDV